MLDLVFRVGVWRGGAKIVLEKSVLISFVAGKVEDEDESC